MAYATEIPTLLFSRKYAVLQQVNGQPKQVGIVLANNFSAATRKALTLFNRHVWVERLN
jgi:hypothetical protein